MLMYHEKVKGAPSASLSARRPANLSTLRGKHAELLLYDGYMESLLVRIRISTTDTIAPALLECRLSALPAASETSATKTLRNEPPHAIPLLVGPSSRYPLCQVPKAKTAQASVEASESFQRPRRSWRRRSTVWPCYPRKRSPCCEARSRRQHAAQASSSDPSCSC